MFLVLKTWWETNYIVVQIPWGNLGRTSPPPLPKSNKMVCMWPCKSISYIQVLVMNSFSNPTHESGTGTAHMWETIVSNPTNQTIYPIRNREQQTINTIWLCLFITLFQSSSRALKAVQFFQRPSSHSSGFTRFWLKRHQRFAAGSHLEHWWSVYFRDF
jgi:hypothetical protein